MTGCDEKRDDPRTEVARWLDEGSTKHNPSATFRNYKVFSSVEGRLLAPLCVNTDYNNESVQEVEPMEFFLGGSM